MANAKRTTVFYCASCGYESSKWLGQCPGCKAWNSFAEGLAPAKESKGKVSRSLGLSEVTSLSKVSAKEEERFSSGISEFDRVLGGGIVADEDGITYKAGKLTVSPKLRKLKMKYRDIQGYSKNGCCAFRYLLFR